MQSTNSHPPRPSSSSSTASGGSAYHSPTSSPAQSFHDPLEEPEDVNLDGSRDSEDDIRKRLEEAESRKVEGTEHFRAGAWTEALVAYRAALGILPSRRPKSTVNTDRSQSTSREASSSTVPEREDETELEKECSKARAVLNSNIGACHVKLDEHKEAVEACTRALEDDPEYVKALQRRAASNDKIGSWSSLTSAQEDYTKLLELIIPSSSTQPQITAIKRSLKGISPRLEAAQKAEMAEMMSKLKGLGNSVLGNFGLSTDNFKFEPNGQGGYSMNFQR